MNLYRLIAMLSIRSELFEQYEHSMVVNANNKNVSTHEPSAISCVIAEEGSEAKTFYRLCSQLCDVPNTQIIILV